MKSSGLERREQCEGAAPLICSPGHRLKQLLAVSHLVGNDQHARGV